MNENTTTIAFLAVAGADAGGEREVFLKMNLDPFTRANRLQILGGGTVDEVGFINRQRRFAAGQMNATVCAGQRQFIIKRHGQHQRLELMEPVVAAAENVEQ